MKLITLSDGRVLNLEHIAIVQRTKQGLRIKFSGCGGEYSLSVMLKEQQDIESLLEALGEEADVDHLRSS